MAAKYPAGLTFLFALLLDLIVSKVRAENLHRLNKQMTFRG